MPRYTCGMNGPDGALPKGAAMFLDDIDVTNVAFDADTDAGWVDCYDFTVEEHDGHRVAKIARKLGADGKFVKSRHYGKVELRLPVQHETPHQKSGKRNFRQFL